jgi:hypothetical protein
MLSDTCLNRYAYMRQRHDRGAPYKQYHPVLQFPEEDHFSSNGGSVSTTQLGHALAAYFERIINETISPQWLYTLLPDTLIYGLHRYVQSRQVTFVKHPPQELATNLELQQQTQQHVEPEPKDCLLPSVVQERVRSLCQMGFNRHEAAVALAACDNDEVQAIEHLLAATETKVAEAFEIAENLQLQAIAAAAAAEEQQERYVCIKERHLQQQGQLVADLMQMHSIDAATAHQCLVESQWNLSRAQRSYVLRVEDQQRQERDTLVAQLVQIVSIDVETARQCLEANAWDLIRAQQSYQQLPEVPDSPVSRRTFQNSHFCQAYAEVGAPEGPMDFGAAVADLVRSVCVAEGIEWRDGGDQFLRKLQREAMMNIDDPVVDMVQRMWTSTMQLHGREFCSYLNAAVRSDDPFLAAVTASLSRAINQLCVTAADANDAFPPQGICFRGGGFDERYRNFFVSRRKFRQPCYIATSFLQETADFFMRRSTLTSKVRWLVRLDPEHKCKHVNLVTKRVPDLPDEQEFLFAPYSVFTVLNATWNSGTDADPHVIELMAAADNKAEPEDLPLAPWS